MKKTFLFIIVAACSLTVSAKDNWVHIKNGELWYDDAGNVVQAHAPGFLKQGDTWYMCGEDRSDQNHPDVNLYSTCDFVNWHFEGKIVKNGVSDSLLGTTRMIERAKILYNKKTKKYVVWCHWESSRYRTAEAACFVCDTINGTYKKVWNGRPFDMESRDCNVYEDPNGSTYFISNTVANKHLGVFKLSDDFTQLTSHARILDSLSREAPAIIKIKNRYFMFSSACTGWHPNQCKVCWSKHLDRGWSELEPIGDSKAFRTQVAAILTIKGTKTTTYLYVGDRWKDPDLPRTKTIIFPITFKGKKCEFHYCEEFDLNLTTGEVKY